MKHALRDTPRPSSDVDLRKILQKWSGMAIFGTEAVRSRNVSTLAWIARSCVTTRGLFAQSEHTFPARRASRTTR